MKHIKLFEEYKMDETTAQDAIVMYPDNEEATEEALEPGVTNLVKKDVYRIYHKDGKIFSSGARYEGKDAQGEKFTRLKIPKPKPFWMKADTMMQDYIFYK